MFPCRWRPARRGRPLWQSGKVTGTDGARAIVVLPPHHRAAFGPLRRVVVHRHFRVLDEYRQPRPVISHTFQHVFLGWVQLRLGQLRLRLLLHGRYLVADTLVGRGERPGLIDHFHPFVVELIQLAGI